MKIYSWNVLFENKRIDDALRFIRDLEFDVLCLQEVPESMLSQLEALPLQIASAIDMAFDHGDHETRIHTVILSRHAIEHSHAFDLPFHDPKFPARAWRFIHTMQFLRLWPKARGYGNRHGVYADIRTPGDRIVRVFSVHLTLAAPHWRMEELQIVAAHMDSGIPSIVCGDFNITDSYLASPIGWFFGGSIQDALFPWRERGRVEAFFSDGGFGNPLRRHITHPLTCTQLDHILIPNRIPIKGASVHRQRHGSDHAPVWAELQFQN